MLKKEDQVILEWWHKAILEQLFVKKMKNTRHWDDSGAAITSEAVESVCSFLYGDMEMLLSGVCAFLMIVASCSMVLRAVLVGDGFSHKVRPI